MIPLDDDYDYVHTVGQHLWDRDGALPGGGVYARLRTDGYAIPYCFYYSNEFYCTVGYASAVQNQHLPRSLPSSVFGVDKTE